MEIIIILIGVGLVLAFVFGLFGSKNVDEDDEFWEWYFLFTIFEDEHKNDND